MKFIKFFLIVVILTTRIFSGRDSEGSILFGITSPFAVSLGFQGIKPVAGKIGIFSRGDVLCVSGASDKDGNSISGFFIVHIVPGLSLTWLSSGSIHVQPKLGPSFNVYLLSDAQTSPQFGFGLSPGIGVVLDRLEFGIMSNISFFAPISYSNWIGVEVGWHL